MHRYAITEAKGAGGSPVTLPNGGHWCQDSQWQGNQWQGQMGQMGQVTTGASGSCAVCWLCFAIRCKEEYGLSLIDYSVLKDHCYVPFTATLHQAAWGQDGNSVYLAWHAGLFISKSPWYATCLPAWEHVGWHSTCPGRWANSLAKAMETMEPPATESGLDGGFKTNVTHTYATCVIPTCVNFSWATAMDHRIMGQARGKCSCSWVAQHVDTASSLHITWFVGYHKIFPPRTSVWLLSGQFGRCFFSYSMGGGICQFLYLELLSWSRFTPWPHDPVKPRKWLQQLLLQQLWPLGRCAFAETVLRDMKEATTVSTVWLVRSLEQLLPNLGLESCRMQLHMFINDADFTLHNILVGLTCSFMLDMQLIRPSKSCALTLPIATVGLTQAKRKMLTTAVEVVWSREGQIWSNYMEKIQQLACYTLGYAVCGLWASGILLEFLFASWRELKSWR